jgi:hypothetical protein
MGAFYKALEFEWLYMSPIILAWKVIIIVPTVFAPTDTFEQRVGIAAAQFAFSIFIFYTEPFLSTQVDAMYRIGCVHQLMFLGVGSLSVVSQYRGEGGYPGAMVGITAGYLLAVVGMLVWTLIAPLVRKILDEKRSTEVLERLGLQYSATTSLYVVPAASGVVRNSRERPTSSATHFNSGGWIGGPIEGELRLPAVGKKL